MIHMPHVDSCVIKEKKVSSNFPASAVRVTEMFRERFTRHHLPRSFIYFFKRISVKVSEYFPPLLFAFMPLALQWFGSGCTAHIFHCNSLCQRSDLPFRIRALIMCGRSCCIRSKLFVVRSDCYSSPLCNILK